MLTGNADYLEIAAKAGRFVVRQQRADGAWGYGDNAKQAWADNFHTAYVLLSLRRIADAGPGFESEMAAASERGISYWLNNFFLDDGTPKYYDNEVYPIDIHSVAAAIVALCELKDSDDRMLPLAHKVVTWATENMLDAEGFFYYQKRKSSTVKIIYMRWAQAWMAYALARLIECT